MTRPIKNIAGFIGTGDSGHVGTNDIDQINNYFTGQDQSSTDPVTINTTTTFGSGKLVATSPAISGSGGALTLPIGPDTIPGRATTDTFTNKTADGELNTFPNVVGASSYIAYIAGSNTKVRNTKTGVIDYSGTDATTVLNSCLAAIRNTGRRLTLLGNNTFSLTGTLNVDLFQSISGEAGISGLSRLHATGNFPVITVKQSVSGNAGRLEISNLYLTHNQATTYSDGLVSLQAVSTPTLMPISSVDIHNCYFYDFATNKGNAIRLSSTGSPIYKVNVYNCEMYGFQDQIYAMFTAGDGNSWMTNNTFVSINHWNPNNSALTVNSPSGALFSGHFINCFTQSNTVTNNTQTGYDFSTSHAGASWYTYFTNCLVWDLTAGKNAWIFNGISEVTMLGCQPDYKIGGSGATNGKVIRHSVYSYRYGTSTSNGGSRTVVFPHFLSAAPNHINVQPKSADALGPFFATADGTNITVTYGVATPTGVGNVLLWWEARV